MLMSYLGSLKSLLYIPIFSLFGSSVWTVRLPMVLAGSATVFVFFKFAAYAVGWRAALAGAFLLATDPLFVMTNTFDWGPVALEHLLLVSGCWSLCRFGSHFGQMERPTVPLWHRRERWLAVGFLCFGLALWNKAVFSWALAGLTVGALATLGPWLRREITLRNFALAGAAFVLGAMPLILYNLRHDGETFAQNARLEPEAVASKWVQLESGLQGSGVFGYIAAEEWMEPRNEPAGILQNASAWIREHVGEHRRSGFYWLAGALLLLIPVWWRSRAAWFSLLFCATSWLLMAMTHDAGGASHHVVLLWPFPILFAVAVLARLPRPVLPVAVLGLAISNLLVVNQYYVQLTQHGAFDTWTDAVLTLSDSIDERPDQTVYIIDWGMFDTLNLLHQGGLRLRVGSEAIQTDMPTPAQLDDLDRMLRDPEGLFVGHVKEREAFQGVGARLDARAATLGLRRDGLRVISDSHGHPVFEVFRMAPAQ